MKKTSMKKSENQETAGIVSSRTFLADSNTVLKNEKATLKGELKKKLELINHFQTNILEMKQKIEQYQQELDKKCEQENELQEQNQRLTEDNKLIKERCLKFEQEFGRVEMGYDKSITEQRKRYENLEKKSDNIQKQLVEEFEINRNDLLQQIKIKSEEYSSLVVEFKELTEKYESKIKGYEQELQASRETNIALSNQLDTLNDQICKVLKDNEIIPSLKKIIEHLKVDLEERDEKLTKLAAEKLLSEQKKDNLIEEYQKKFMQIQKDIDTRYKLAWSVPLDTPLADNSQSATFDRTISKQKTTLFTSSSATHKQDSGSRIFSRKRRMPPPIVNNPFVSGNNIHEQIAPKKRQIENSSDDSDSSQISHFKVRPMMHNINNIIKKLETNNDSTTTDNQNQMLRRQQNIGLPDIEISETISTSQESDAADKNKSIFNKITRR